MTVGKPNFNLNSFGIKYLSKDEVQAFLNKESDTNDNATGKYGGNSKVKPNADISPPYTPNLANPKMEQNPKGRGAHVPNVTNNEAPKVKPDENTKYVFNDPTYGIHNTRKPQPMGKPPTGTIGVRTANDTRGYSSTETAASGVGNAPKELSDSLNTEPMKQGKSTVEVGVGSKAKEVFDKKDGVGEKYVKTYDKDGNKITAKQRKADAEKESEAKSKREKETKVNQVKEKLKLQEAQNKKIKKPYVEGDKNVAEDIPTKGTDMEDNVPTQDEPNKPKFVPERPKTGTYDNISDNKETAKRKKEAEAKAAAAKLAKEKPIDWKKTHDARRQRVEEYRSERGLKNASDIIMDMAIMKLDLMKTLNGALPSGKVKLTEDNPNDTKEGQATNARAKDTPKAGRHRADFQKLQNATIENRVYEEPDKSPSRLVNQSAETVFKAISLKLDLMKVSTFKPNKKVTHLEELQDRAEQIEIHDMDKKIKESQDDKKDNIMINKP